MSNAVIRRCIGVAAIVAGATACATDETVATDPPEQRPESALSIVRASPTAPSLVTVTASFYAKRGTDREIRLYYRPRAGRTDSTEFLRFRVRRDGLSRRPDGTPFAVNDSVLITIRVADPTRFQVEFQPSGLEFSSSEPAELKLSYKESDGDIDGDGDSDGVDRSLERQLAIWFQETSGQPWYRLTSTLFEADDDLEAKLTSFTTYLVAY